MLAAGGCRREQSFTWFSPDRTQLVKAGLATFDFAARHQTSVQGENKEAAAPCLATVTAWKYSDEGEWTPVGINTLFIVI